MAITSASIVTLYDDAAKTKAFAPRTKVEAISNSDGVSLENLLNNKLNLSGGTMTGTLSVGSAASIQTNGYITGTWLKTTANIALGSAATSFAVINDGWIYSRTASQVLSDIGAAPSSHSHNIITYQDTRNDNQTPDGMPAGLSIHLKATGKDGLSDGGSYHPSLFLKDWSDYSGGPYGQLSITANQNLWFRASTSGTAWGSWKKALDSSNYSSYALPISGGTLSGSLTIGGGADLILKAGSAATTDSGDVVFQDNSGTEIGRIWLNSGVLSTRTSASDSAKVILHSGNYSSYTVPKTGGTFSGSVGVGGELAIGGPIRIHAATGTSGSAGYIKFATIKITDTYVNAPIMFLVGQRGKSATCFCWVQFQNANSTDPGLAAFRHLAWGSSYGLYIVKSATSTWDLYIAKSESYDRMGVSFHFSSQTGYSITYGNTHASSLPSGYVSSTLVCQTTSFVSSSSSQPTAISTGDIWFVT